MLGTFTWINKYLTYNTIAVVFSFSILFFNLFFTLCFFIVGKLTLKTAIKSSLPSCMHMLLLSCKNEICSLLLEPVACFHYSVELTQCNSTDFGPDFKRSSTSYFCVLGNLRTPRHKEVQANKKEPKQPSTTLPGSDCMGDPNETIQS